MICVLALIVFAILGIFSATHRKLAKEAFDCVFRKLTLRKCQTGLDKRIRAHISGPLLKKTPLIGKVVYKYFSVFSWIFTLLLIVSIGYAAYGGVNYYLWGNCNGVNDDSFCVFDPTGSHSGSSAIQQCIPTQGHPELLSTEKLDYESLYLIQEGGGGEIIFAGCYNCEYTKEGYEDIMELAEEDVTFYWAPFPVHEGADEYLPALHCLAEQDPGLVQEFNDAWFVTNDAQPPTDEQLPYFVEIPNEEQFQSCLADEETAAAVAYTIEEIKDTGIYGTPTVFVNGQAFVGPKPTRVYKRFLE